MKNILISSRIIEKKFEIMKIFSTLSHYLDEEEFRNHENIFNLVLLNGEEFQNYENILIFSPQTEKNFESMKIF